MSNERISESLRALPHEEASPEFTAGVLGRLSRRRRRASYLGLATAAVLVLALGLGWSEWRHQQAQQQALARLDALLAEKQVLEFELRYLRQLTDQARPVVYLGATEKLDLVLDLAHLHSRGVTETGRIGPTATQRARLTYLDKFPPQRVTY